MATNCKKAYLMLDIDHNIVEDITFKINYETELTKK